MPAVENCESCKFFKDGDCVRFPPTPVHEPGMFPKTLAYFPVVKKDMWCGEWGKK